MSNKAVKAVLWWLCLLVAPAVLIAIELFHPAGFTIHPGMYEFLSKPEPDQPQFQALNYFGPNWWFTLHMIQTPMVGLVAVGWPTSPKIEALRDAWFTAPDLAAQKALADQLQLQAFADVPYIPLGQYFIPTAYQANLTGMLQGGPVFWNIRRT